MFVSYDKDFSLGKKRKKKMLWKYNIREDMYSYVFKNSLNSRWQHVVFNAMTFIGAWATIRYGVTANDVSSLEVVFSGHRRIEQESIEAPFVPPWFLPAMFLLPLNAKSFQPF